MSLFGKPTQWQSIILARITAIETSVGNIDRRIASMLIAMSSTNTALAALQQSDSDESKAVLAALQVLQDEAAQIKQLQQQIAALLQAAGSGGVAAADLAPISAAIEARAGSINAVLASLAAPATAPAPTPSATAA